MRAYIHTCIYVLSVPSGSVRPSFMNARSTNDARAATCSPLNLLYVLPSSAGSVLCLVVFFFVVYHTRLSWVLLCVSRCARVVWTFGCTAALILSPFFLLFFCFFFLLTIFTLIQWIRRVEMVLSYHSICLLRFSRLVILLYRNIQTHLILLRLRSHTIVLLPFPSHTVTLIRSSSLSHSRTILVLSHSALTNSFFSAISLSFSLSHSRYHIHTPGVALPRTIDFSSSFPLRGISVWLKRKTRKNVKLPHRLDRENLCPYTRRILWWASERASARRRRVTTICTVNSRDFFLPFSVSALDFSPFFFAQKRLYSYGIRNERALVRVLSVLSFSRQTCAYLALSLSLDLRRNEIYRSNFFLREYLSCIRVRTV